MKKLSIISIILIGVIGFAGYAFSADIIQDLFKLNRYTNSVFGNTLVNQWVFGSNATTTNDRVEIYGDAYVSSTLTTGEVCLDSDCISDWSSFLSTSSQVIHNNTTGLQGGDGNYYHSNQPINTTSSVTFASITSSAFYDGSITPGQCVQVGTDGRLTGSGASCATSSSALEADPIFMASSSSLPYVKTESDPVFTAVSTTYLTTTTASSTYFKISDWLLQTTDNLVEGITNLYFTIARARESISSLIPAITYSTSTGQFSLTSGYEIPLSASTTNWNSTYNIVNSSSTFWDTAYSWGNHALAGYLTTISGLNISLLNNDLGYITTTPAETDPVWDLASTTVAYLSNNQTFTGENTFTATTTFTGAGLSLQIRDKSVLGGILTFKELWGDTGEGASFVGLGTNVILNGGEHSSPSINFINYAETAFGTISWYDNYTGTWGFDFDGGQIYTDTGNSLNWDTAYGWGNHADAGYLTTETDPVFMSASTSLPYVAVETDPIYTSDSSSILRYGTSSDTLSEGSTNLFWTIARFTSALLGGYNAILGNSTTTNATTTNLYVSGETKLGSLSGLLKATNGLVSVATAGVDYIVSELDPLWSLASTSVAYLANSQTFTDENTFTATTTFDENIIVASGKKIKLGSDEFNMLYGLEDYKSYFIGNAGNDTVTGSYNLGFGSSALLANTSGNNNNAFGNSALRMNETGYQNTAIGSNVLHDNVSGNNNSSIGTNSLYQNIDGSNNIAVGYQTMRYGTSSSYNNAFGYQALMGSSTSYNNNNNAFGYQAGFRMITGSNNNIFGRQAGFNLTTGDGNVLIGNGAGSSLTSGSDNLLIGTNIQATSSASSNFLNIGNVIFGNLSSGYVGIGTSTIRQRLDVAGSIALNGTKLMTLPDQSTLTGSLVYGTGGSGLVNSSGDYGRYNTLVGIGAGNNLTTGIDNVANGYYAGASSTSGVNWTALGSKAGSFNTNGSGWTSLGYKAGYANETGSNFTAIGNQAGSNNISTGKFTALGAYAGYSNTTGNSWVANGYLAGTENTTGDGWVAVGDQAGTNNITGSNWTALGYLAGSANTSGGHWTAIGYRAGFKNLSSDYWTAISPYAGYENISGTNWTAIGYGAGRYNTTGNYWTALGVTAGYRNATGTAWTALGYQAGRFLADGTTEATSFDKSVYVGAYTRVSENGVTNENAFGYNTIGNGSDSVTLGNTSITKTILRGNVGIASTSPNYPLSVTGNAWFSANVSALSFTDRTPSYDGDALKELSEIKGKNGEIDHSTLPEFARKVTAEGEDGRDLGAMISMLVKAVQQIKDYLSQMAVLNTEQDKKIKRLEEQNILLMERLDRLESLDKNLGGSYIESTNKEPIVITPKLSPQTIIEKLRKLFN